MERLGRVYMVTRHVTLHASTTIRLNRVAYDALAAAIGVTPAPAATARSPYIGMWHATYTGSEAGDCPWVMVDAFGRLGGGCTANGGARSFELTGDVSALGGANASSTAEVFTGTFLPTSASGTWRPAGGSTTGNWTATKY